MAGLGRPKKVRELLIELRGKGWRSVGRTKGSHEIWEAPTGRRVPIVINHKNATVSRTILHSIHEAERYR